MAQQPIEMILLHLWASYIAVPMWVVDVEGNLVYYNEPAEQLIGARFDDAGEINASQMAKVFVTTDLDGKPLTENALTVAMAERQPAHGKLRFRGFDDTERAIEITALPIVGQGDRLLGALAAFWEIPE
jgi:PAS domain-containing protein